MVDMLNALDIHVTGIVQGVGFRPFVYRLAKRYLVNGWVLNAVDGVHIHAEGEEQLVDEFIMDMHNNPPAAAHIKRIDMKEVPLEGFESFEIRFSDADAVEETTLVSPDLATCGDCLEELFDPTDRRYRYPFLNCTNCGPRFTIIESLPYDRASTSMASFKMCPECAAEYADASNRRFHAQPDACFECGPQLCFAVLPNSENADASASVGSQSVPGPTAAEAPRDGYATSGSVVLSNDGIADATASSSTQSGSSLAGLRTEVRGAPASETILGTGETLADSSTTGGSPFVGVGAGIDTPSATDGLAEPVVSGSVPEGLEWMWGENRETSDAIIAAVVEMLAAGKIVAVKGLGGFHLVCDAANAEILAELRRRKRRDGKAFAVMLSTADEARLWCEVNAEEEALLKSPARPIVLLRKKPEAALAQGLADGLPELGVMLPATPLQHLLLHDFQQATGKTMLVFTSGNVHDEPIQIDDNTASKALAGIADALLGNNRPIRARYDDSVVRVLDFGHGETAIQFIRRARGYAPLPIDSVVLTNDGTADAAGCSGGTQDPCSAWPAPQNGNVELGTTQTPDQPSLTLRQPAAQSNDGIADAAGGSGGSRDPGSSWPAEYGHGAEAGPAHSPDQPSLALQQPAANPEVVFATGPEQKNTFCFLDGARAFVSQHIGDMENVATYDAWLDAKATYERLFELAPTHIVSDMHPEYLTSKWAAEQALPVLHVQHHHAHIASAMAENALEGPVVGFAFDGTGYGADGAIWGGEVLLTNLFTYERFANFAYFPLPGGAAAIKHPLRCAYGALWAFDLLDHPAAAQLLDALDEEAAVCERMIETGLNTPYTSSVGRLFDAVSALLGLCVQPTYEGEGAVALEAAILPSTEPVNAAAESASAVSGLEPALSVAPAAPAATSSTTPSTATPAAPAATPTTAPAAAPAPITPDYQIAIVKNASTDTSTALDTSVVLLDAEPLFRALLDDMQSGISTNTIARKFHDALVDAILQTALLAEAAYSIRTIVLSGGVFMNRYLSEHAVRALANAGFTVAMNRDLPPNDGCISYGQAVIATRNRNKLSPHE